MKEKLIKIFRSLFGYGIGVLMIAAFLVALVYLAAFIIGRPHSEIICGFLDVYILPSLHIAVVAICILGVITMYLRKEYTFIFNSSNYKEDNKE